MTIVYRCIGKGTTNANGVAKLTHDCQGNQLATEGYAGTGAGQINIVASTVAPSNIDSSSLQSEPYTLWDTLYYDSGIDGTANTNWVVNQGEGTKSVGSDGTTLSNSNATRYDIFTNIGSTSSIYDYQPSWCIEVDILAHSGNPRMQIYDGVTSEGYNGINGVGHWKITYDGTTVTSQKDDGTPLTYTRNMPNARIGFYIQQNESIKFKDLKIYPI